MQVSLACHRLWTTATSVDHVWAGDLVPSIVIAYQTYGTLTSTSKIILVSTCFGEQLSGKSNPLIGPERPLDPNDNHFIIRIGLFGGSDSSSPSNTPPPFHRENFPNVTYSDNIRAQVRLLDHLGLGDKDIWACVGFSMGGQWVYHWGVLYPKRVKKMVVLASSSETSLHNVAFLEGPKGALIASGSYDKGSKGPAAFGR